MSVLITLYYCIYTYIRNKRVFKCEITFSPYCVCCSKEQVLRLKESKDEQ